MTLNISGVWNPDRQKYETTDDNKYTQIPNLSVVFTELYCNCISLF